MLLMFRQQITTNSNLLTPGEVKDIAKCTNIDSGLVSILSLQSFDTEQQFCRQLRYESKRKLVTQHRKKYNIQIRVTSIDYKYTNVNISNKNLC